MHMNYISQNSVLIPQKKWLSKYVQGILHPFKKSNCILEVYSIAWENSHNVSLSRKKRKTVLQQNV